MKNKCVICKEVINEKHDYFQVKLFRKGKLKGIDYAHEACWINRNNVNESMKEIINGASNLLKYNEINDNKEEVYMIK